MMQIDRFYSAPTFCNLPDVDGLLELAHVAVVGRDVEDRRQRLSQLHRELGSNSIDI